MPALVTLLKQKQQFPSNTVDYANGERSLANSGGIGCHSNKINNPVCKNSLDFNNTSCHSNRTNVESSLDTSNNGCHNNGRNSPYKETDSGKLLADCNSTTCVNNSVIAQNKCSNVDSSATNSCRGDKIDSCHDDDDGSNQKRETLKEKNQTVGEEHDGNADEDEISKEKSNSDLKDAIISESIDKTVLDIKKLEGVLACEEKQNKIEFGTVMVLSCCRSCWDSEKNSARQEYVFVQADPDAELFQKKV